jgi:hypothetical protein
MRMYPRPSCPDRPSSVELSVAKVDIRICKILDLVVNPNPRVGPVPLWRGVASARVSTLIPISVAFVILSFHYAHDHAQGLRGSHDDSQDAISPEDATEREVRCASDEEKRTRRDRGWRPPPPRSGPSGEV